MSESLAKVTMKSVTAEQMYPIMIPATRRAAMFFMRLATRRMNPMDTRDPTKAAAISEYEFMVYPRLRLNIIIKATTIFAPDEIPSTNGPAMGLPKKVWRRNPDTDRPPPRMAAMSTRGRRIFQIML